jgi:hypothetical protein
LDWRYFEKFLFPFLVLGNRIIWEAGKQSGNKLDFIDYLGRSLFDIDEVFIENFILWPVGREESYHPLDIGPVTFVEFVAKI